MMIRRVVKYVIEIEEIETRALVDTLYSWQNALGRGQVDTNVDGQERFINQLVRVLDGDETVEGVDIQ